MRTHPLAWACVARRHSRSAVQVIVETSPPILEQDPAGAPIPEAEEPWPFTRNGLRRTPLWSPAAPAPVRFPWALRGRWNAIAWRLAGRAVRAAVLTGILAALVAGAYVAWKAMGAGAPERQAGELGQEVQDSFQAVEGLPGRMREEEQALQGAAPFRPMEERAHRDEAEDGSRYLPPVPGPLVRLVEELKSRF